MKTKMIPRFTTLMLEQQLQKDIQELALATDAARLSDQMQDYLDMCARFHHYSFCNVWMILSALPDATRVAGYRTWKSLGRYVRKGENGIPILAPILIKKTDQEDEELVRFKVVYVFDISQTEGEVLVEPPDWKSKERDGELTRRLKVFSEGYGIRVSEEELVGDTQGVSKGGEIVLARAAGTKTLIHELAHELMHHGGGERISRRLEELEAESVAYVVSKHFGLGGLASPNYTALHGASGKDVLAHMDRIQKVAGKIIKEVETIGEKEVEHVS